MASFPTAISKPTGAPVNQGLIDVTKPLKPQLEAIGYEPDDIKYIAFSHYHIDHTANANMFAGSTWLVNRRPSATSCFPTNPRRSASKRTTARSKNSKTTILPADSDYDVFGDGTVIIKPAPGHTPGHQVLFLKLRKTGPVLIAGDLYHYNEERNTDHVPNFEYNKEQSLASRAKIEQFLKTSGAQLWIEHDYRRQRQAEEVARRITNRPRFTPCRNSSSRWPAGITIERARCSKAASPSTASI